MELKGERLIPAPVEHTWAALNDPEVLKGCVAGCESLERTAEDAFHALMAVRIGPVSARFKGHLKLADVNPPTSYTIHFEGQGGMAGHGKGSADVVLAAAEVEGHTVLTYVARAQVGGKIAQIGSRLVDAAAGKIAEEFFVAFEGHFRARQAAAPAGDATEAAPADTMPDAEGDDGKAKKSWLPWKR